MLRVGPVFSDTEPLRMNDVHKGGALANTGTTSNTARGLDSEGDLDPKEGLDPEGLSDDNSTAKPSFLDAMRIPNTSTTMATIINI